MSCLDNAIKLSRTECECFTNYSPLPAYNEGQSEVYLDELEGLSLASLQAVEGCEEGGLWQLMDKSRTNATLQFKSDILSRISENYISKRPNYSGIIGQAFAGNTLSFSETYAGVKYFFPNIIGGYFNVKRIGLLMNNNATVVVQVYDNDQNTDTPIAQYTVSVTGGATTYATIAGGLKLPMWNPNGDRMEYYFVYQLTGGFSPRDNKKDCGCGNKNQITWNQWMQVFGIRGSNTNFSNFSTTNGNYINGLVVDAELKCENGRLICSDEMPLDFENDPIAMQTAYAIRFKAGALLIDEILSSPEINRYTMMDREALYGKRNYYRKSYEDLVVYLGDKFEVSNMDCLMCRNSNQFAKGKILA